jgi:antitoxin HigA-1
MNEMFKNGMRPVHPGEVLLQDFLKPLGMSANALAKALRVPAPRINDVVRGRRGRERGYSHETRTIFRR